MSKKKKILRNPEIARKSGQLKGFEDILDMLPGSRFETNKNARLHDDFELLNLLEVEIERLGRLNTFLGEKVENMKNFGQSQIQVQEQKLKNQELLDQVVEGAIRPTSILNQNIKLLFNQAFTHIRERK